MTGNMIGETLPLSQHELIGAMECAKVVGRVCDLSAHWTCRAKGGATGGFYSLGAASYMDAAQDFALYQAAAQTTNKILLEHFGGLYDRLTEFLRKLLDEEVSLDLERGVPGFHVFVLRGEDRSRDNPAERAHYDLQWRLAYPGFQPEGTLSFTLTVSMPTGGAGLAIWPFRWDELNRDARRRALEQAPQVAPYALGRLVLHDGLILHAIGAAGSARATGHRITLQGHGIRRGGRWWLYW
jgi:hypothetical protein